MTFRASDHIALAKWLASLLDNRFKAFGFSFGLDPLLSIVPGIGTLVPTIMSLYLLWIGIQLKLPKLKLLQMGILIVLDGAIGSIPIIGFLADAVLKANIRNLHIVETFAHDRTSEEPIAVFRR